MVPQNNIIDIILCIEQKYFYWLTVKIGVYIRKNQFFSFSWIMHLHSSTVLGQPVTLHEYFKLLVITFASTSLRQSRMTGMVKLLNLT